MEPIRERSGNVDSDDPLEVFLYLLMRDLVPLGDVEKLVKDSEMTAADSKAQLSNGWLAKYAKDLAARLRP
jgi:hypothetical protein